MRAVVCLFALLAARAELRAESPESPPAVDLDAAYEMMKGRRPLGSGVAESLDSAYDIMRGARPLFRAQPENAYAIVRDTMQFPVNQPLFAPAISPDPPPRGPASSRPLMAPLSFASPALMPHPLPSAPASPSGTLVRAHTALSFAAGSSAPGGEENGAGSEGAADKVTVVGVLTAEDGERHFELRRKGAELVLTDGNGTPRAVLHHRYGGSYLFERIRGAAGAKDRYGLMVFEREGIGSGRFIRYNGAGKEVESYSFSGSLGQ